MRTTLAPILVRLGGPAGRPPRPAQILDLKVCDPAMGSGAFLVEACRQLGDALVAAWHAHGEVPAIPPDEREDIFAMRLVAQRCLYGVDRNPVAVDLAKVSLWLATLARDHALTFVDHALRHGDSLVGLSRKQIEAFHWDPVAPRFQAGFETMRVREHMAKVAELRRRIREADESVSDWELRDLWDKAQFELGKVRLFGDLVLAAFFEGEKPKEREGKRAEYASAVVSGEADRYHEWLEEWRNGEQPLAPFHWEIEFPEVFARENPGFDAIAGNPPFLGGTQISEQYGMSYFQWLTMSFHECRHHCDLVAYFFRRSFTNLRDAGCLGFIATNTISQGDTREGGLRVLINEGGEIYHATRRLKWPGLAAVVVSVLHLSKNHRVQNKLLDGLPVPEISAYLVNGSVSESPARLSSNPYFSLGSKIYGQGFLFADDDPDCTSVVERERLLAAHPDWKGRIPPYIGGEEINSDPLHRPRRFVISLSDVSDEGDLNRWPELKSIVEQRVKPERLR
ncbi:MAG: SAM-dependent methyltransferase, partial [Acidobacteria bacterium]